MPRHIILVSAPRSGTNFHQAMLQHGLKNAVVFREMFNPLAPFGLESNGKDFLKLFQEETGFEYAREKREALSAFFRQNPVYILDVFSRICDRLSIDCLSYTLFPKQISEDALRTVLYGNDCACLFLTRRRLARHVSFLKAEQSGVWRLVDTTALKVEVSLSGFLDDAAAADDWFRSVSGTAAASGAMVRQVSYDAVLNQPPRAAFHALEWKLRGISELSPFDFDAIPEFKQDAQKDVFRSVSNAAEFRSELREASRHKYAFDEPEVYGADGYV